MSDNNRNWSYAVTHRPPATFPPEGLYTKDAKTIYLAMRRPDVSPNGLASAIMMVQFFINRSGKNLPIKRKLALKKAIYMLRVELRYLNQREQCKLDDEPIPVFPPPEIKIGGKHG